jgi:hypothetical protein
MLRARRSSSVSRPTHSSGTGRDAGDIFLGIVAGTGKQFTQVTLAWTADFIAIDKIMFDGAAAVPAGASLVLFVAGAGLGLAATVRAAARPRG